MNYKAKIRDTNRPFLLQDGLDKIIAITAERLASVCDICVLLTPASLRLMFFRCWLIYYK